MADDKNKTDGPDRTRISPAQGYEVRHWAQKSGVTPDDVRAAVEAVGNNADDVDTDFKTR